MELDTARTRGPLPERRWVWWAFAFTRALMVLPAALPGGLPFFDFASEVIGGAVPYSDVELEYPPGAVLLLVLPRVLSWDIHSYAVVFALQMVVFDLWIARTIVSLSARVAADGRARATLALAAWVAAPVLLGSMLWHRFDLVVAALMLAATDAAVRGRAGRAGALLAVGVWIKLVPVLLLPLVCLYSPHGRPAWRAAAGALARFGLVSLALWGAVVAKVGVAPLQRSFAYHAERGLQLESVWATAAMIAEQLGAQPLRTEWAWGAFHLAGGAADRLLPLATPALGLALLATLALSGRHLLRIDEAARPAALVLCAGALLVVLLLGSKVLSPQFLVWSLPFAAVLVARGDARGTSGWAWLALACGLTWLVFPGYYDRVQARAPFAVALLLARNAALLCALLAWLGALDHARARAAAIARAPRALAAAGIAAWGATVAYLLAANWIPAADNDIWFHLRVGLDVLASGEVPRVDEYSATARGRPFIAHSWLSAAIFARFGDAGAHEGLTLLRVQVVFFSGLALVAATAPAARGRALMLPLALLLVEALTPHVAVRPVLFAVLLAALVTFVVELSRRLDKPLVLAAVVPLTALWANLHGSFLLAPAFLVVVGTAAWLQTRSRGGVARAEVVVPFAVALACVLAAGLNPYGFELHGFTLRMLLANDYIKDWIIEWRPVWAWQHRLRNEYLLVVGFLALIALGLLRRRGRNSAHDVLTFLFVVALFVTAYRFAAYVLVFGFPLATRLWCADDERPAPGRRPFTELLVAGVLLLTTLGLGAHSQQLRTVPLGLGAMQPRGSAAIGAAVGRGLTGNTFADYPVGSYMLYGARSFLRPVIDPRIDVYGEALAREYFEAREAGGEAVVQYVDRHDVDVVLITSPRMRQACRDLIAHADWQVVWQKDDDLVLARR
jgi:hypothetical protein